MNRLNLVLICALTLAVTTCSIYKSKYDNLVYELKQNELQSTIVKEQKEKQYANILLNNVETLQSNVNDIDTHFNSVVNRLDSSNVNGLYNFKNSKQNSAITAITDNVSEVADKQLRKCRADYKAIRTEYLIMAKDRDIVIAHYNSLIDWYENLRAINNK